MIGFGGAPGALLNYLLEKREATGSKINKIWFYPGILVCVIGQSLAAATFSLLCVTLTRLALSASPDIIRWVLCLVAFFVSISPVRYALTDAQAEPKKETQQLSAVFTLPLTVVVFWLLVLASSPSRTFKAAEIVSVQEFKCTNYVGFTDSQKIDMAYGYLEGVQAALEKDVADILVPPSDTRHPMWWVLPRQLGENPLSGLAQQLNQYCQSAENWPKGLLDAFLSIAYKKGGWPAFGISIDKTKTDPWKGILGGKESSVSCSAYNASPETTRQLIVDGYYFGSQALGVTLKQSGDNGLTWPSKSSPQTVRMEVDKRCQKDKGAKLRDVLWICTAERDGVCQLVEKHLASRHGAERL